MLGISCLPVREAYIPGGNAMQCLIKKSVWGWGGCVYACVCVCVCMCVCMVGTCMGTELIWGCVCVCMECVCVCVCVY